MDLLIPFGAERKPLKIRLPRKQILLAQSKNPSSARDWAEVVGEALPSPVGAAPLHKQDLRGKKIVIITEDRERPSPVWQALPVLLEELHEAGAEAANITFITACGMHDTMTREQLAAKLGENVVANYRCLSHDAGDRKNLVFCGLTDFGIPVWINRSAAEADFRIALGRIYPHESYGYEGGYKMILPGVAGYDTISRHHAINFAETAVVGNPDSPSRREADAVGALMRLDFLINVVVNRKREPIKAFCGEPLQVHRLGVAYGDQEVWGAEIKKPADIVVASPGSSQPPPEGYNLEVLYRAARAAKAGGCFIYLTAQEMAFDAAEPEGFADAALCGLNYEAFREALPSLAFEELLRLHHLRHWPLNEREIQWRLKALRIELYRRQRIRQINQRRVILTSDPNAALKNALSDATPNMRVIIIPEAETTMAKEKLFRAGKN
jgi:nickel-dependent lactate racemase